MDDHNDPTHVALNLLHVGVLVADSAGRIAIANNAARVLLGLDGPRTDNVALRCEGRSVSLADLLREQAHQEQVRRHVTIEHPERGWLRGTLTRVKGVGRDPWVHLMVERGPTRDWRRAGHADPLSAFAHEQRNTLTALREGLAILMEGAVGDLSEEQQHHVEELKGDADRMTRLVSDMIAANRLRAANIRVTAHRVDVGELLHNVARSFRAAAAREQIDLHVDDPQAELWCQADKDLLTQALANLVNNALKSTPSGGSVRLAAQLVTDDEHDKLIELLVRDTGPGMSQKIMDQIRGKGAVKDGPSAGPHGSGLGIGLSIVRGIAELHGGRLEVETEEGSGSCFRVRLPVDFRVSERWLLAQITDAIRLAQAVGSPLSVVEIGLPSGADSDDFFAHTQGLVQLPLIEQCVQGCLRPNDSVLMTEKSSTLVLHAVDGQCATRVAQRTVAALRRLLRMLPEPFSECELTYGIASYPAEGTTAAKLIEVARHRSSPNLSLSDGQDQIKLDDSDSERNRSDQFQHVSPIG